MPLWDPYDKLLDGKIADFQQYLRRPFAGSITAALFLRRFVEKSEGLGAFRHLCLDPERKSARPEGGEVQVARLLFDLLESRYGAPHAGDGGGHAHIRDPRLTPARPDLAAAIFAARSRRRATSQVGPCILVPASPTFAATPRLQRRSIPRRSIGEDVMLYDEREGWAWVQLANDGYVGYVARDAFAEGAVVRDPSRQRQPHLRLSGGGSEGAVRRPLCRSVPRAGGRAKQRISRISPGAVLFSPGISGARQP